MDTVTQQDIDKKFYGVCSCGRCVWDYRKRGAPPDYFKEIICLDCGTDNSLQPPLMWRIRYAQAQWRKRRRILGEPRFIITCDWRRISRLFYFRWSGMPLHISFTWGMFDRGLRWLFLLPREREKLEAKCLKIETSSGNTSPI